MPTSVFQWVSFVLIVGIVLIGLFIGYQAYRGFRRHESRSMRLLSIGLIFLTALGPSLAFATWLGIRFGYIPEWYGGPLAVTYRVFQFVGLALIAYSLYQRPT